MPIPNEWPSKAKRLLKAELKRHGVTYEVLAQRLSEIGLKETEASVSNKISRGAFTASFLLASLKTIGANNLRIDDL